MDQKALDKLLLRVLDSEPDESFELKLTEPAAWATDSSISSKEADLGLQEAQHQGLIEGQRGEGDGSISWWSNVRLTVEGLRRLGEWPPAGGEHLPGPWDKGVWGQVDRPLLVELAENPPHADFEFKPEGGATSAERKRWWAVMRLFSARLIDGGLPEGGLDALRITVEGRRTLEGPTGPLDRALVELRRGAKADAMTAAVDEALAGLLRKLATAKGLATKQNGKEIRLNNLADQLKKAGAFQRDSHAEIEMCLALRNETDHGRGANVSESRIERAIETVRELEERLSP
jgi:hypothetical protein